jgi:hypothetical protein
MRTVDRWARSSLIFTITADASLGRRGHGCSSRARPARSTRAHHACPSRGHPACPSPCGCAMQGARNRQVAARNTSAGRRNSMAQVARNTFVGLHHSIGRAEGNTRVLASRQVAVHTLA